MKLVDTSAWIEQLRRGGDEVVRERVEELLASGEAAWCSIVRLELWNGAQGPTERRVLREMQSEVISLDIGIDVWNRAIRLAAAARDSGVTIPSTDLLVAACAREHRVAIEHSDTHFDLIAAL